MKQAGAEGEPKSGWFRQYVIGLGVGTVSALYGLIALWWGHTFLPGLKGGTATVTGCPPIQAFPAGPPAASSPACTSRCPPGHGHMEETYDSTDYGTAHSSRPSPWAGDAGTPRRRHTQCML